MTTPTALAELVRRTAIEGTIDERPGVVAFRASLTDAAILGAWIELRTEPPEYLESVAIHDADTDESLAVGMEPRANGVFRITVRKMQVEAELRLFFANAVKVNASAWAQADLVQIAEMAPDQTFTTYRNRAQIWTAGAAALYAPTELLPDPRALVHDFTTGASAVPEDIRPWLQRTEPARSEGAYESWRHLACRRLIAALCDRVSNGDTSPLYHFDGPPSCDVRLSDAEAQALFDRLTECVTWIFVDGLRDTDTRHLLVANEWARSYRREAAGSLGDGALRSAKAAYSAYVKSGSKETLKAIADLRKAVVEEAQRAAQRAQELASSLWKDVAIAAVPFVLKAVSDLSKSTNQWLAGAIAGCAAIYLIFSFSIQAYINHRYFFHQKKARGVWQLSLNTILSPAEIQEFSEQPIRESVADYRRVRFFVGLVYAVLVALLISLSANELGFLHFSSPLPSQVVRHDETKASEPPPAPGASAPNTESKPKIEPKAAPVPTIAAPPEGPPQSGPPAQK